MKAISVTEAVRLRQRRKLSLWLEEWRIDRTLAAVTHDTAQPLPESGVSEAGGAGTESTGQVDGRQTPPAVGQIRLLPPVQVTGAQDRPVYVLVLEDAGAGAWRVVPFSRFANPAIPGEWMTGLRGLPLRVLCLWNARIVAQAVLAASWISRTLPAGQVGRAQAAWRDFSEGCSTDRTALTRGFGPPLEHPLDPRHEYIQEERGLLDASLGAGADDEDQDDVSSYEVAGSELRKAAEAAGEYDARKKPGA